MSLSGDRLAKAEQRSDLARTRLRATAERLKWRLSPRRIAADALGDLRQAGESGAERARRHPLAIASVTALFSAISWALRRRRRRAHETQSDADSFETERAEPRRSRRSR